MRFLAHLGCQLSDNDPMRALVVAVILAGAGAAHAQSAATAGEPAPTVTERYGATIAIADAISVAALGTGVVLLTTTEGTGGRVVGVVATVVGAGGYIWASPIVHQLRGRRELAKVDIAMRVVIPGLAAGIAAGTTACTNDEPMCEQSKTPIFVAGAAGIAVATTIDIVFFAKHRVPYVAPARDGGVVAGIGGVF
jgi:hypothetical protein